MLTSSGQKRYEYVGLEKIDGLRLLHIERPTIHHHGESTSPAQLSDCRLHLVETSLARAPPYQTVSYAWGDSDRRCSMALANGEIIDITNHLSVALPYFLAATKHEYLWIDQICINQMDLDERAQQVSMMGQIYEKGDGVLVFLCEGRQANPLLQDILRTIDFPMGDCELGWGPGADLKRAFRLIETLLGGNPEVERPEQWCEDPVVKAFHTHHVRGDAVGRDVSWHALRSMISEIFTSTWASITFIDVRPLKEKELTFVQFSRVWVVQEAVLSPKVMFLVGPTTVSARQIGVVCHSLWDAASRREVFQNWHKSIEMRGYRMLLHLMDLQQQPHGEQRSLYGFLGVLRSSLEGILQATDQRDIVYGILGLTHAGDVTDIVPDYRLPVHLLYASIARLLTVKDRSLEVLCTCDGIDRSHCSLQRRDSTIERTQTLPSWVPNWTTALRFQADYPIGPMRRVQTCGASRPHITSQMASWDQLPVRGKVIGTVRYASYVDVEQVKSCFYAALLRPHRFHQYEQSILEVLRNSEMDVEREANVSDFLGAILYWSLRVTADGINNIAEDKDDVVKLYEQLSASCPCEASNEAGSGPLDSVANVKMDVELLHREAKKLIDGKSLRRTSHWRLHDWGVLDRGCAAITECPFDAFYWTTDGRLVLTFSKVRAGDQVAIFHGYRRPVIIDLHSTGMHKYVTSCFCEGAMGTSAMTWADEEADNFTLN